MPLHETPEELPPFPPAQVNEGDRKKLKQIYLSLILIGLAIGGVLSVGIVVAMNHFGLTARPEPVEQSQSYCPDCNLLENLGGDDGRA